MLQQDTITALVTAVGESSVGIIRISGPEATSIANKIYKGKVFSSAFQDYILTLPDYTTQSLNYSKYRVIIQIKHKKDGNNYYSFSTMEVNR